MSKKTTILILSILFFIGLFLRLHKLEEGLIFGYDQARDMYRAGSIIKERNIKLLGPETDIPGVNHGVGYYYVLAIPLLIKNNPTSAATFLAVLNALGIFLVWYLAYRFFDRRDVAVLIALLFTFSFEIIQYGRWMSNPSLGIFCIAGTYLCLWLWIKRVPYALTAAMTVAALAIHFQLFLLYLLAMPVFVYVIYKPKLKARELGLGLLATAVIISPFLLAEWKFKGQAFSALLSYFSHQSQAYEGVSGFLIRFLDRFAGVVYHTIFPFNATLSLVFIVSAIAFLAHQRKTLADKGVFGYLVFWLVSSMPIFIFSSGALNSEFGLIAMSVAVLFITGYFLYVLYAKRETRMWAFVFTAVILLVNIRFTLNHAHDGAFIFSVQGPMTYGYERKIVDYTYRESEGKPFSICTVTNPLFINTTWAYLYESYGKNTYGYVPFYSGPNQEGRLGTLPSDTTKPPVRFLITEPEKGLPMHAIESYKRLEDYVSDVEEEQHFGDFSVQKRKLLDAAGMEKRRAKYTADYNRANDEPTMDLYRCYH